MDRQRESSSSIDLVFKVYLSLHPNCQHQIVQWKLDFIIFSPPLYQRLVWDYKRADVRSIRKALDIVSWENLFRTENIEMQISILNEAILNVFHIFFQRRL